MLNDYYIFWTGRWPVTFLRNAGRDRWLSFRPRHNGDQERQFRRLSTRRLIRENPIWITFDRGGQGGAERREILDLFCIRRRSEYEQRVGNRRVDPQISPRRRLAALHLRFRRMHLS